MSMYLDVGRVSIVIWFRSWCRFMLVVRFIYAVDHVLGLESYSVYDGVGGSCRGWVSRARSAGHSVRFGRLLHRSPCWVPSRLGCAFSAWNSVVLELLAGIDLQGQCLGSI